ncbi:MAG: NUDIX domain-containing protein [Fimbriimonadaceae bacterium]|nr:NUDIX domain-containing protein [Fimbriimonadaceae bacterium]
MKPQIVRISAYGLLVEDERLLLCRISDRVPGDVGKWTLPGGGLDFGEAPVSAVVREVEEETGIHVAVKRLVEVESENFDNDDRLFQALRIIYEVHRVGGNLRSEADGSTDLCAWWTRDEISELPLVPLVARSVPLAFSA